MHRLLKRQLKKIGISDNDLTNEKLAQLIKIISQAYYDADDDRNLLENTLHISSHELQDLYQQLKQKSATALAKSEEKYRKLVTNLEQHYFYYSVDTDGNYISVGNSIEKILGYTPKEYMLNTKHLFTPSSINRRAKKSRLKSLNGDIQPPYLISVFDKKETIKILELTETPFIKKGEVISVDGIARDVTKDFKIKKKIAFYATKDTLTGIANRLTFEKQLKQLISFSERHQIPFALLFLDIDNFKHINDTFGHDVGDLLLQKIVNRIAPSLRKNDFFSRIGGDEFIIIINNIQNNYLSNIINKIMDLIHKPIKINTIKLNVSTSIGIALYPNDATTQTELMKKADLALYKAKDLGRDNYYFYTDTLNNTIHQEMQFAQSMKHAVTGNQFQLYYQPKLFLKDDAIIGAEALIRWNHPTLGLVYPDKFITLAENIGYIEEIGNWVIQQSCHAIKQFNQIAKEEIHLSLNVSPRQLQLGDLYQTIKTAIQTTAINPAQLFLEFTESIMIHHQEQMIERLQKIKTLGVHICMDDFGTGYSSLSYINTLPIDSLKIDKSFIDQINQTEKKALIVDTIIAMGNTLNMPVIAEGVETEQQRQYLIQKGCLYYQGYLFSKAVTEQAFTQLIQQQPLKKCH